MPFENNGIIITGLYEKNESPVNHTANDNLANMDPTYAYEVTKGALGAALEFAEAYDALSTESFEVLNTNLSLYPNPANNHITISFNSPLEKAIDFKLIDLQGKEVLQTTLTKQTQKISVDSLSSSSYLAVFKMDNHRFIKKLIIN